MFSKRDEFQWPEPTDPPNLFADPIPDLPVWLSQLLNDPFSQPPIPPTLRVLDGDGYLRTLDGDVTTIHPKDWVVRTPHGFLVLSDAAHAAAFDGPSSPPSSSPPKPTPQPSLEPIDPAIDSASKPNSANSAIASTASIEGDEAPAAA